MNVGHGTTATVDGGVSSKQLNPSQVLLHHGAAADETLRWIDREVVAGRLI